MLALMDRSTLRLPDPDAPLPNRDRRRTVRQRLHTPVYVSFNTPQSGAIIDLSELLDLHEYGFAVQTAVPGSLARGQRLDVNRAVTLCLDLPETRQYVHGSGQVMWTDDTGRAGIRFSFLPDRSRQALKEWLFANLLVASTNHAARVNQLAQQRQEFRVSQVGTQENGVPKLGSYEQRAPEPRASELSMLEPAASSADARWPADLDEQELFPMPDAESIPTRERARTANSAAAVPDRAELLSALDEVRRQIREILVRENEERELGARGLSEDDRVNFDAALQLITERAASLTYASGAALALLSGDKVICRATVGQPAPPWAPKSMSELDCRENACATALSFPVETRKAIRASILKFAAG